MEVVSMENFSNIQSVVKNIQIRKTYKNYFLKHIKTLRQSYARRPTVFP